MMSPSELVEAFYSDVWNRQDLNLAHKILSRDFKFRGSLGSEKQGVEGFLEYHSAVHAALGSYTCTIKNLICMDDGVAARLITRGIHQATLFGVSATHKEIEWGAAAFFRISEGQLSELWVLGDIDAVKQQLHAIRGNWF